MFEFLTQTQLGELFGVSSHVIGRWLVEIGLRTSAKKPSQKAHDGGYCKTAPNPQGFGYFWVWHREKTIADLVEAGHALAEAGLVVNPLAGPFSSRQSGLSGYEILNGDGTISVWIVGEENAARLVRVMNLADDEGQL